MRFPNRAVARSRKGRRRIIKHERIQILCAILTFLLFFPLRAVFAILLFVVFLSVWPVFAVALFAMIWLTAMECVNGRISRMDVAHGGGVTLKMGFGVISFFALVWLIVKLNLPLNML